MALMVTPGGRLYHTGTGRFLSRDPSGRQGDNPYVGLDSNPLNRVDPKGAAAQVATVGPPGSPQAQIFSKLTSYLSAQQAALDKLCVGSSGAISIAKPSMFAAAVQKSGFEHERTRPPDELKYVEGSFVLSGSLGSTAITGDYVLEECLHALFYQSKWARLPGITESQGAWGGKNQPVDKLWKDDVMLWYMQRVHFLLAKQFPLLEAELKKGPGCDPEEARRQWRAIVTGVTEFKNRLGRVEQIVTELTGFHCRLELAAAHYSDKKCGLPECCGGVPVRQIMLEELARPLLRSINWGGQPLKP